MIAESDHHVWFFPERKCCWTFWFCAICDVAAGNCFTVTLEVINRIHAVTSVSTELF